MWIDPEDSRHSLVIGAEKVGGLTAFDLHGHVVQHVDAPPPPRAGDKPGRFNNLDVLYDVKIGGHREDIVVVSDRGLDKLHVFKIDRDRHQPLTEITAPGTSYLFSTDQDQVNDQATAYGVSTWQAADGTVYVLATREQRTDLALVKLTPRTDGTVGYQLVRRAALPKSFTPPNGTTWAPCAEPGIDAQAEGMVVDEDRGLVYVSQEDVGVWRIDADLAPFHPVLVDKVAEFGVPATYDPETEECTPGADPGYGGKHLHADAEGLSIYHQGHGKGYLIASSQGDKYLGQFRIGDTPAIDGTQDTDSFCVANAFPKHLKIDTTGWDPRRTLR